MESSNKDRLEKDRLEKEKLNKDGMKKILAFVRKHVRYIAAGVLFLVLILVLVKCAGPNAAGNGNAVNGTEQQSETGEEYQVNAFENVNNLVSQYYTAYAAGDIATLTTLATPVSDNEQNYIRIFSQYVEEYRNITCYTKSGLDANSYLVYVASEMKFTDVDTTAPALDFFYIRTNEEGSLYIDNIYSQYNRSKQESAMDISIQNLMHQFVNEPDALEIQNDVKARYEKAVTSDENLSNMITNTIPTAIQDWSRELAAQNAETPAETPTEQPTEAPEEQPTETPADTPEETPAEQPEEAPVTETLTATDRVNVRSKADSSSDRLGSVEKGQKVTRTGTEGDWSIIDYNGKTGYIKSEFLTSGEVAEEPANAGSLQEGTVVTLGKTVNIRSSMSETADKVGTAYAGEKVTVVMSYAEGWTKVKWSSKTGYIKTSLLQ